MDSVDIQIISELQKDSRLSIRELSKRVHLSAPSLAERIRKLENKGIIESYTITLNKKRMGFPIDCFVMVTMRNGEYERFRSFIKNHPRSDFCYRITGDACFLVKFSIASLEEIEGFITEVTPFANTKTFFSLSEVDIDRDIRKSIS
ncbi:Lrp/AsnC family transcriptional regulator [Brevibacillus sp. SIMBA_040]|uniref:Lrp/AsnC family transcriptional regulator n=1 Tax=unclassified Brevibacillus TaxID=2684853 RepID=UPI00397A5097